MTKRTKHPRRRVELVDPAYQPTKADVEEEIDLSHLAGKFPEDLARMVLAPVDVRYIPRPRRSGHPAGPAVRPVGYPSK